MEELQTIKTLISEGAIDEAAAALDRLAAARPDSDEVLYMRGKLAWRRGDMRRAVTDFNAALALNPDSPARVALDQATSVLNFYNTDLYNP